MKIPDASRFGYLNDKDVLRLLEVKDTICPVVNYKTLINTINSNQIGDNCLDFHP